jgi:cell wall assembly regulator SMI1
VEQVDFLIKKDYGMVFKLKVCLIVFILICTSHIGVAATQKIKENNKMENIWKQYIEYWQKHDKEIKFGLGDNQSDIKSVEEFFHLKLPISLKKSLSLNYHSYRKGKNSKYPYSWFGDLIETKLLTAKMMIEEYTMWLKPLEINEGDMKSVYVGDIKPYTQKGWIKDWLPILTRADMDMTLFLDLRSDSNKHGQVLLIYPSAEVNDEFHNRFAFVADSFEDFMKEALEYMKIHKGLDNDYFLKKLELPLNYYDE